MKLFLVAAIILLLNIPFGYWRSNKGKLSVQWFMAIHIPIPLSIGFRFLFLGRAWALLPVLIAAFAAGQYTGGRLRFYLEKRIKLSSCLVMDLIRNLSRSV